MTDGASKTVLITGGYGGLGLECGKRIAACGKGWTVVVAGRDIAKAQSAANVIGNGATALKLNLASLRNIRESVVALNTQIESGRLPPLRGLVLNAGIQTNNKNAKTEEGFELTFGVNHLGHFLLANLLLKDMRAPGRVVVTTSGTHDANTIEGRFNKPSFISAELAAYTERAGAPKLNGVRRYSTSKLANVLFAYELSRRLERVGLSTPERPLTVNAYDPGAVPTTGLLREHGPLMKAMIAHPRALKWMGVRVESIETAGGALARLVTDETLEGVTRQYYQGFKEARSANSSYDEIVSAKLWVDSEMLVGLQTEERIGS
ncbi:SDR family NAD(P)-dependent oxidoreductase [Sphingorhabdus contaminans]|uniref:SDR family NAD(P)-dependent oxidoreductase n=1 Tax=Sphingorhabdus contaminans TaxID=1343899 RepID=UPI003D26F2FB